MNFCKDCKHFAGESTGMCNHPSNWTVTVNPVTGVEKKSWNWTAHGQRQGGWLAARSAGMCGREGRWFEEKSATVKDASKKMLDTLSDEVAKAWNESQLTDTYTCSKCGAKGAFRWRNQSEPSACRYVDLCLECSAGKVKP